MSPNVYQSAIRTIEDATIALERLRILQAVEALPVRYANVLPGAPMADHVANPAMIDRAAVLAIIRGGEA